MTVSQRTWWKNNLFNVSTLIAMLTFIVVQAQWQEQVNNHIDDDSVHMPFEKKIQIFVPRVELEGQFVNIKDQLDRIENKLDK